MARRKIWGPPLSFRLKIEDDNRLRALIPEDEITPFLRDTILEKLEALENEAASDSDAPESLAA